MQKNFHDINVNVLASLINILAFVISLVDFHIILEINDNWCILSKKFESNAKRMRCN